MRNWTPELKRRLTGLSLRPEREAEVIEELSLHLEDRYVELRAAGQSEEDAQRLALADLKEADLLRRGMAPLRQASAPEALTPGRPSTRFGAGPTRSFFADLFQDVRYAVRMLKRQPGFAAAAALTLALGIGANTAAFSVINALLIRPMPITNPDAVMFVHNGSIGAVYAYPEYVDLRDAPATAELFEGFVAFAGISASLSSQADTDLVSGVIVTGNFFEMLGVRAARGRVITRDDDVTPGAHPVVVISHGLWQSRLGGVVDVVGSDLRLNGQTFKVVGVLPAGFDGVQVGVVRDVYVPMMMQAIVRPPRAGYSGERSPDLLRVRGNRWLYVLGRLKLGITSEQAATTMSATATAFDRSRAPEARPRSITMTAVATGDPRQREVVVRSARLLMAVVGAVLLIACANIANLLLSRASARRRELAVRLALGASRGRLVRQLLAESVVTSCLGGLAGLALAVWIAQLFRAAPPPAGALPFTLDFAIDGRVLLFTSVVAIGTGILFGLAPALRASRPQLVPALKDQTSMGDDQPRRFNLKRVLVVGQVALSLLLLLASGLLVRSLRAAQSIDPGFAVDKLVNAPLSVNLLRYTTEQGREYYRRAVEEAMKLPGVSSASVARVALLSGGGRVVSLNVEGRAGASGQLMDEGGRNAASGADQASANVIGSQFFKTLEIAMLAGRDFSDQDAPDAPLTAIVSQTLVRTHFPGGDPIGQRLSVNGPGGPWRTIVGVVGDSKYATLDEAPTPVVYLPLRQNHETGVILYVRTGGSPSQLVAPLRSAIQAIEPNLPVSVQPVSDTVSRSLYAARMGAWLVVVFSVLALLLATIGVYGVLAFSIARRRREIGIRMALGARAADVVRLILTEGLVLVAAGVVIGLGAALLSARLLASFLYGVSALDFVTFAAMPVVLIVVASLACLLPARRAATVDPVGAMRN